MQPERRSPDERASLHQLVLNASWPYQDAKGNGHARGVPEQDGIDVRVRLVWGRDGEEWLNACAKRWTKSHVCLLLGDERLQVPYVWVHTRDVVRV